MGQASSSSSSSSSSPPPKSFTKQSREHCYNGEYLRAAYKWQEDMRTSIRERDDWFKRTVTLTHILDVNEKASASSSIIAFGYSLVDYDDDWLEKQDMHTWGDVAIKISFDDPRDGFDTTLRIERDIVEHVFTYLMRARHTPNVIAFLGNRRAPLSNIVRLGSQLGQKLLRLASVIEQKTVEEMTAGDLVPMANFLFMDQVSGQSMRDFLHSKRFNEYDFWTVLFQIYYTLECFRRLGIRHNDLHLGNIMIRKLARSEELTYVVPSIIEHDSSGDQPSSQTRVTICVTHFVEFFDMDRAAVYFAHDVARNLTLDISYCSQFGECNKRSDLFDTAGFNMCLTDAVALWFQPDASENDWRSRVINRLFDIAITPGQSTYRSQPFPQLWLHRAEMAQNANTISKVRGPLWCMHETVKELQRMLTSDSEMSKIMDIVDVQSPASPLPTPEVGDQIMFSLPPQVAITIGSPRRTLLSQDHYEAVSSLRWFRHMKRPEIHLDQGAFQRLIANTQHRTAWHKIYLMWNAESKQEMPTFDWSDMAAKLFLAYSEIRANQGTPLLSEALPAKIACLMLSCPMYYGILPHAQSRVRRSFIDSGNIDITEVFVLQYEKDIWMQFSDTLTPIQIPLLYNCKA